MRVKITRYLIALALALLPTLAPAQTYTDEGLVNIGGIQIFPATGLQFTLVDSLGGAVITGLGSYDLAGNDGKLTIPADVMSGALDIGVLQGIFVSVNLTQITTWLAGGIPVVGIGDSAFQGEKTLTSLDMTQATSLNYIGGVAFDGCSNITGTLAIPNGVKTISSYAFQNCIGLTGTLDLSNLQITQVNNGVFYGCGNLTGLKLPDNITSIGNASFQGCAKMAADLVMPATLKSIGNSAFSNNAALTSLDISNATSLVIDGYAFYRCTNMKGNLVISAAQTEINDYAFYGDAALTGLDLSNATSLNAIYTHVFDGCVNMKGDLVMPAITVIDDYALNRCQSLRSMTFGTQSITFGTNALHNCSSLEYIDMSTSSLAAMPTSFARGTNGGNPFYGISAHTVIYLPTNADKTLIPASPDNINFVLGGTCDWFYVQDLQDYYIPHTFTAAKATWNDYGTGVELGANPTRTLPTAEFCTAYLPYDFTLDGLAGYALGYKNNHKLGVGTDNTFVFNQVTSFAANTPYVVRGSGAFPESTGTINVPATPIGKITYDASGAASYDGGTAISNNNGNPNGAPVANGNEGGTWGIYGTTESIPSSLCGTWMTFTLNSDAKWYSYDNTMAIPQFRAFIVGNGMPATSKPSFSFVNLDGTEDTTTSIDGLDVVNTPNAPIYNIGGVYVGNDLNAQPKGLYIVNGKKVVK